MFIAIARNPVANREMIVYGILMKLSYSGLVFWYWFSTDIPGLWKPFAVIDLVMAVCSAGSTPYSNQPIAKKVPGTITLPGRRTSRSSRFRSCLCCLGASRGSRGRPSWSSRCRPRRCLCRFLDRQGLVSGYVLSCGSFFHPARESRASRSWCFRRARNEAQGRFAIGRSSRCAALSSASGLLPRAPPGH